MTCSKTFSLTIDSGDCPNWASLFWSNQVFDNPPNTTWSQTPLLASGDSYDVQGTTDATPLVTLGIIAQGQLNYNGPGCNCQITLDLQASIPVPGDLSCTVYVLQDGAFVLVPIMLDGSDSGLYTYPFSLVDTLGASQLVQVVVQFNMGESATIQMTGTISSV